MSRLIARVTVAPIGRIPNESLYAYQDFYVLYMTVSEFYELTAVIWSENVPQGMRILHCLVITECIVF